MTTRPRFDRAIAHRGLHDRTKGVIENSRSAFAAAMERGFDIECDVQLSRDGVPMIFHDDDLERLTGLSGPAAARDAAELEQTSLLGSATGDTPQRLTTFLQQIGGRTLLQIELKRQPTAEMRDILARATVDALVDYAGAVTIESFDPHLLNAVRRHGYKGPLGIITYQYMDKQENQHLTGTERWMLRHLLHWPWTRFDFISCGTGALNLPVVRLFRTLGVPVTAWTVRSPQEAQLARIAGACQIVFEGFDPDRG